MRKILSCSPQKRLAAIFGVSLVALVALVGGLVKLSASATGSDECNSLGGSGDSGSGQYDACRTITLADTNYINSESGYYDVQFSVNGGVVNINITGADEINSENGHAVFYNGNIENSFQFTYAGDFEDDNYKAFFYSEDGFRADISCAAEGNPIESTCSVANDDQGQKPSIPDGATFAVTINTPPAPQNHYGITFDNVSGYDETNGSYVDVTSNDAEGTFRISIWQGGIIDKVEDHQQGGYRYEVSFDNLDNFKGAQLAISKDSFDPETLQITARGPEGLEERLEPTEIDDDYVFSLNSINLPDNCNGVNLSVETKHNSDHHDDDQPDHPGVATNATVRISSRTAGDKSFHYGMSTINNRPIIQTEGYDCSMDPDNDICTAPYEGSIVYNKEEGASTVEIVFATRFDHKFINNTVIVNGTEYAIPIDYNDRASWLAYCRGQLVGFEIDNIPAADHYEIVYDIAEQPGEYQFIGNFLWTNDENEKYKPGTEELSDIYIGHSNLRVRNVLCHVTEYDADDFYFEVNDEGEPDRAIPDACVFEYQPDNDVKTTGSLVVPQGSTVTVQLKTEYGWQVTSFGSNGSNISVDPGKVAQYTFGILNGNAHLGAITEPVDDEVNADSESVQSGSISLGGQEITEGTALLTVGDTDLTEDEMNEFQNQAGDYTIQNFLSIDLDQIFYDGHGSYWKGAEMKELANEATITLTLEEGVDGNSVVLVHQKHDGSYEIIPSTYDPATHTITFKTSSFSNYAIASTTVNNSNTLDNILKHVIVCICSAAIALFITTRMRKESTTTA